MTLLGRLRCWALRRLAAGDAVLMNVRLVEPVTLASLNGHWIILGNVVGETLNIDISEHGEMQ
jgi:hypothetical protein